MSLGGPADFTSFSYNFLSHPVVEIFNLTIVTVEGNLHT